MKHLGILLLPPEQGYPIHFVSFLLYYERFIYSWSKVSFLRKILYEGKQARTIDFSDGKPEALVTCPRYRRTHKK